mmetsp:Transcript_23763/g.29573  ORF Transcript_23763/g.29573 Transcript_23763/m.29573 type:complete len:205 (+) Transcript_23763:1619-2233(+)
MFMGLHRSEGRPVSLSRLQLELSVCKSPMLLEMLAWRRILEKDVIMRLLVVDGDQGHFELLNELRHQEPQVVDLVLDRDGDFGILLLLIVGNELPDTVGEGVSLAQKVGLLFQMTFTLLCLVKVEDFVSECTLRQFIERIKARFLFLFGVVKSANSLAFKQDVDCAHLEIGLPAKLQFQQVDEKWLEVVDEVLVGVRDACRASL